MAAAALVVAAAPGPVRAHEAAVLDLEDMERLIYDRAQDPFQAPLLHGAYTRLLGRFEVSSEGRLSADVKKILICAKVCEETLSGDAELAGLADEAAAQASAALAGEVDDLASISQGIHSKRGRAVIRRRSASAQRLHERGAAKGALGRRVRMLAHFRKAALRFEGARSKAARLLDRQRRRPAPGQPLPKGDAGTIDTYVGNGLRAYDEEGLPARETALYWPLDMAVDPRDGLLLVCDSNNHRVRRLDADGRLRTVIGSGYLGASEGPALEADIHHPSEIVFEPGTGALVVAGWHSEVVHRLDRETGLVAFIAGDHYGYAGDGGPVEDAQFSYPVDVEFGADGSWYVSDQANRRIRRVDGATGIVTTLAGTGEPGDEGDGGPAAQARIALEAGENLDAGGKLALDPTGRILYLADTDNHRVRGIDLESGHIFAVAGTGAPGYDGDGGPAADAQLSSPADVDCDAQGNVYIADRGNDAVRRVDVTTGAITTVAGSGESGYRGDGGPAAQARLDSPAGVFVDRARGRLYVADTGNSVIRVVWE